MARSVFYHVDSEKKVLRQVKECNSKMEANPKGRSLVPAVTPANIHKVCEMVRKNPVRTNNDIANSQSMFKLSASCLSTAALLKNLKLLKQFILLMCFSCLTSTSKVS